MSASFPMDPLSAKAHHLTEIFAAHTIDEITFLSKLQESLKQASVTTQQDKVLAGYIHLQGDEFDFRVKRVNETVCYFFPDQQTYGIRNIKAAKAVAHASKLLRKANKIKSR